MGKAKFGIVLDNGAVEAGGHLKGVVFVDVDKQISGTEMKLKFSGQESTCVSYSTGGSNNNHRRTAYGKRNIIEVKFPLDGSEMLRGNKIEPGAYKMPFDLELPCDLPSSMSLARGSEYSRIAYKIKAELKGSGTFWNYRCDRDVVVRAKALDIDPVPFNGSPCTQQVRFLCCLNRGSVSFGAAVSDTRIARGQSTSISMSCRNQTRMRISSVHSVVRQLVTFSAGHHKSSMRENFAAAKFDRFEGMDRALSKRDVKTNPNERTMEEIFQEIQRKAHELQVAVPQKVLNSYQGSIIQVRHTLEIIVQTSSCITNPTIKIPLQIGEPQDAPPPLPSAPYEPVTASAVVPSHFTGDSTKVDATIYVPSTHVILGGLATEGDENAPVALPVASSLTDPSFENLLTAMKQSIADFDLIQERSRDPAWKPVFQSLSIQQYGTLLKEVDSDFDETRVAVALADQLEGKFTCEYVVAALRTVSDWNRSTLVERLLTKCSDFSMNSEKIKVELTDWELMVTESSFQNALR